MPRQLRLEYPGAAYHVMSRGNRRTRIFLDDVDRHDFIKTLAEACRKTGWQVLAYCLMPNHYHLVVETPEPNLVAGMAWLQSTYTIRLNHRHKLFGHVFSGRYKSQLIEGSGDGYLRTACKGVGPGILTNGLTDAVAVAICGTTARLLRFQYPVALYHAIALGNESRPKELSEGRAEKVALAWRLRQPATIPLCPEGTQPSFLLTIQVSHKGRLRRIFGDMPLPQKV